jgi:serine/threonine-protein kinase
MPALPVAPGDVLAGRYRVERVLGSGGMGVVVAAIHVELAQRVAVKFLLPSAVENGEAASRFLREARAAVKIDSEHVARVLDVGKLDNGAPYMVMEYLEGHDLSHGPTGEALPIEEAVDYVLQACAAMAVAHSVGIVHRDLKPANLFITSRPDGSPLVKVLDFGISKMSLLDAPAVLTHTSAIMGSPLYMSPEQAQSARTVDARTDIWSLGVILYELITGVPPFQGESLTEVLSALITTTPKPLRELRPSTPPGLERAVLRALEKSLARRFANVGELSAALVEFAPARSRLLHERVSGVLVRAGISSAPPPPGTTQPFTLASGRIVPASPPPRPEASPFVRVSATDTNWAEQRRPPHRRLQVPILVTLVAALVAGALALGWKRASAPSPSAATAQAGVAAAATPNAAAAPKASAPITITPESSLLPSQAAAVAVEGQADAAAAPSASSAAELSKGVPHSLPGSAAHKTAPAEPVNDHPPAAPHKKNPLHIEFK